MGSVDDTKYIDVEWDKETLQFANTANVPTTPSFAAYMTFAIAGMPLHQIRELLGNDIHFLFAPTKPEIGMPLSSKLADIFGGEKDFWFRMQIMYNKIQYDRLVNKPESLNGMNTYAQMVIQAYIRGSIKASADARNGMGMSILHSVINYVQQDPFLSKRVQMTTGDEWNKVRENLRGTGTSVGGTGINTPKQLSPLKIPDPFNVQPAQPAPQAPSAAPSASKPAYPDDCGACGRGVPPESNYCPECATITPFGQSRGMPVVEPVRK